MWGLFDQNISLNQLINSSSVLCYSAKWRGEKKMHFDSVHQSTERRMLKGVRSLLDEADAVATYNGNSFDLPTLNKELLIHRMNPPAPYKTIDLLQVARQKFRFVSRKMDYISQALGEGAKVRHPGFQMWVDCLAGDDKAWAKMEKYNRQDVVILERLYDRMLPWIPQHPHMGAFADRPDACPRCEKEGTLKARGTAVTRDTKYKRYQCGACGGWSRGKKAVSKTRTTLQGIS